MMYLGPRDKNQEITDAEELQIIEAFEEAEEYLETGVVDDYLNRKQKSFYGKARIITCNDGQYLQSYETIVARIDNSGNFARLWAGYSATTAKHIDAFRRENGLPGISKKDWDKLPVVAV